MILHSHNAFLLSGKNFSYAFYTDRAGYLHSLHFGGKIGGDDLQFLISRFGEPDAPDPEDRNGEMQTGNLPQEYGSFGRGDYREPSAIIAREDGAAMSRFRFVSFALDGAPDVKGLPHARGGKTLSVTLKDDFSPVEIVLSYTVYDELDVLVRNAEFRNTGKRPVTLKRAFSFCFSLPDGNYRTMRLYGNWAKERYPEITPLGYGVTRLQSLRGASSHQMNPFLGILGDCTENEGECRGVQLIYSGSFALLAERNCDGTVRVQGGINDLNFSWELGAGETFATPQAAMAYSNAGMGGLSRAFSDFIRQKIMPENRAFSHRPLVVNNWEATYFDFDNEKLFPIIDEAARLGIDTFVLDDGWFGKRDSDTSGLGDWVVNGKKLRGGLKPVIERCKKNGLKFGLWFEPEMISEDSDLYRAHPDWAIKKENVTPVCGRNQLVLDFTRKEVIDHVFNAVAEVLKNNEISYVKWDMNRNITECYSPSLPAYRQGEFMHRYILGVYDLAFRLTSAFPNVFFEGCAGGGGRFDAGMLFFFPQIWTSDDTDGYERTKIQWGTSMCYPVSAMSCHVSACPNHQTQRTTPFQTRGAIASLGATGYELDLSKMSEEEKEETKKQIENYRKIQDLVLAGDLYRLLNPFDGEYFCEMLVSKDKSSAYVVGERFRGDPCDRNRIIRLNGLDEDATYHIEELNISASGKTLKNVGLLLPRLPDCGAWTWHIKKIK